MHRDRTATGNKEKEPRTVLEAEYEALFGNTVQATGIAGIEEFGGGLKLLISIIKSSS